VENWLSCDLTDPDAAKASLRLLNPDIVVHLAGLAFVAEDDVQSFYRVNVLGTINLLQALFEQRKKPARILIASSANVYGNAGHDSITEEICPAPVNHYGASKLAMEHMVRTWFNRLPIVITRPFNYTGPGQDERFVIPKIIAHYQRRAASISLGDTHVERDFTDIEDVIDAYIRLLESDVHSEIVNICSGRAISVDEVISEMNRIAGYAIEVRYQPELMRASEIKRLVGSSEKLRRLSGFSPCRPFRETLHKMYNAAPSPR
jgi:nucleoside-diphosphate-sugar epimerase